MTEPTTVAPTTAPTATSVPKPVLDSIYVDGHALTLTAADGSVIASLDFFQPQDGQPLRISSPDSNTLLHRVQM